LNNPNGYGGKLYIFLQIFVLKLHQIVHFGLPKYFDIISKVLQNLKLTKTKIEMFPNNQILKQKNRKRKKKKK
jgi:hypothetical protein